MAKINRKVFTDSNQNCDVNDDVKTEAADEHNPLNRANESCDENDDTETYRPFYSACDNASDTVDPNSPLFQRDRALAIALGLQQVDGDLSDSEHGPTAEIPDSKSSTSATTVGRPQQDTDNATAEKHDLLPTGRTAIENETKRKNTRGAFAAAFESKAVKNREVTKQMAEAGKAFAKNTTANTAQKQFSAALRNTAELRTERDIAQTVHSGKSATETLFADKRSTESVPAGKDATERKDRGITGDRSAMTVTANTTATGTTHAGTMQQIFASSLRRKAKFMEQKSCAPKTIPADKSVTRSVTADKTAIESVTADPENFVRAIIRQAQKVVKQSFSQTVLAGNSTTGSMTAGNTAAKNVTAKNSLAGTTTTGMSMQEQFAAVMKRNSGLMAREYFPPPVPAGQSAAESVTAGEMTTTTWTAEKPGTGTETAGLSERERFASPMTGFKGNRCEPRSVSGGQDGSQNVAAAIHIKNNGLAICGSNTDTETSAEAAIRDLSPPILKKERTVPATPKSRKSVAICEEVRVRK